MVEEQKEKKINSKINLMFDLNIYLLNNLLCGPFFCGTF